MEKIWSLIISAFILAIGVFIGIIIEKARKPKGKTVSQLSDEELLNIGMSLNEEYARRHKNEGSSNLFEEFEGK